MRSLKIEKRMRTWRLRRKPCSKEVAKPNVDTEARWVKKMGKLHFGYKRHTVTDENGMVLAEETTAANEK